MNRNFVQGRWILSQDWVGRDLLRQAYQQAEQQTGSDLCALLLSRGLLTLDQAEQARQAAMLALMTANDSQSKTPFTDDPLSTKPVEPALAQREPTPSQAPDLFESQEVKNFLKNMAAAVNDPNDETAVQSDRPLPPDFEESLPSPGEVFHGYEILDIISTGAQGRVLRGKNLISEQVVALKLVRAEEDSDGAARFQREAKTLCELRHPNIVRILDVGLSQQKLFYAMEELEGQTLRDLVKNSLLTKSMLPAWSEVVFKLEGIAGALAYCHDMGLIHRDVKPSNIVLESHEDRAVLVDFGLVRSLRRSSTTSSSQGITKTGEILGTPAFMSPEQFAPRGVLGTPGMPSDVWGFGATLYYCLTGNPPYHESTFVDIYKAVLEEEIKAPRTLNGDIPDWLNDLCMQCLHRDPEERPTMKDVLHSLVSHNAQVKKSLTLWPVAVAIFLTAFASTLFILSLQREEPGFVFLGSAGKLTRNKSTVIEGRVNKSQLEVRINQNTVDFDKNGVFREEFELVEGQNTFLITLLSEGKALQQRTIVVSRDTEAPQLLAENKIDEHGHYLTEKALELRGFVKDQSSVELFLDRIDQESLPLNIDNSGRFSLSLEDRKTPQVLTLRAKDQVGNQVVLSWTVCTPKAMVAEKKKDLSPDQLHQTLKGLKNKNDPVLSPEAEEQLIAQAFREQFADLKKDERAALACLFSRRQWRVSSAASQRKAIDILSSRIDKSLVFKELKEFSVGEESMRIAVFEHRPTAMAFHLIPGDVIRANWWLYPDYDWLYQHLESLLENPLSYETLSDFFYTPTTYIVREEIAKTYPKVKHYENWKLAKHFSKNDKRKKQLRSLLEKQFMQLKKRAKRLQKNHVLSPFFISQTEVTRGQWSKLLGKKIDSESPELPQTDIPYGDVQKALPEPLRIPTRLEWLYAASAGTKTRFYWGDDAKRLGEFQWSKDNSSDRLHPPRDHKNQFNLFGLIDVYGNASEWADPEWARWTSLWSETTEDPKLKVALQMMSADLKGKYVAIMGGDVEWKDYLIRNGSYYFMWVRGAGRRWMSDKFGFRLVISLPK